MQKIISKTLSLLLITLLTLNCLGCGSKQNSFIGKEENLENTIYICSDLHLLSNNVIEDVSKKGFYTSDGRVQAYDYDLAKALVDTVNSDKPDALILTGDLSYNGERDSHEELIKILDEINKDITVLVIPGNHDTYILDGLVEGVVTDDDFRNLYKNYGYTNGFSYDETSLSYAYQLSDDIIALMLDTNLCRYNEEESRNIVGGFIYGDTLDWMEQILIAAKAQNQRVICFTHHNLVNHSPDFLAGYTLINHEYVVDLLTKYDVTLNFSGHLHIQSITETEANGKTLRDVASSSLLTYSNTVGKLNVYTDGYEYKKTPLLPFENFTEASYNNFVDVYFNKSVERYKNNYPDNYEAILKFTSRCNALYFDGDYEGIHEEMKKNKKLLNAIKKNSNGILSHFFEVPDENQKILAHSWLE